MKLSYVKQLVQVGAISALVLGGCAVEPAEISTLASAATVNDTDLAPECAGIISYVNTASLTELDSFLPSDVANALVQRRGAHAFTDIADISSVSGVAQARLSLIVAHARAGAFIGPSCAGVYEELSVSADDATAILAFANTATEAELWDVVRTEPDTMAPLLVSSRPYTTLQQLVNVSGVGPSTFRSLRDAAVFDAFDDVVERANTLGTDTELKTAFNWYSEASESGAYHQASKTCFGVPYALVEGYGQLRSNLADATEVMQQVTYAVNYANRYGAVGSSSAGLAHLATQVAGGQFFGCYISWQPNPWCGYTRRFFVNKDTGYRVLADTWWCE
jgi:DNA uptake protein ComE-like DNA-binding protein